MSARILLVDDETTFREAFAEVLRDEGFDCTTAGTADEALELLRTTVYDLALLDIRLPGMDGVELLGRVRDFFPQTLVIMVTAHGTFDSAIEALRQGAVDYLAKPVEFDEALLRIRGVLDKREAAHEIQVLRRDVRRAFDFENIVGRSEPMAKVFGLIERVAATMSSVLLSGETGTGKELAARAIHHRSEETRTKRFVAINCSAIPDTLLESELFGYMKGAFTGAVAHKRGLMEVAGGGTVFLDEIGEMGLSVQAKLLRAIERKEIVPLGGTEPVKLRIRVISSSHQNLARLVEEGRFREDLFHRINVVELRLPPLRDRTDDIPLLVEHFIERTGRELKRTCRGLEPGALCAFMRYPWKGNVRELANVVERAMILGDTDLIRLEDLPPGFPAISDGAVGDDLREVLARAERLHVLKILRATAGDKAAAAERLGIGVSTLYRRIDDLGLKGEVDHIGA